MKKVEREALIRLKERWDNDYDFWLNHGRSELMNILVQIVHEGATRIQEEFSRGNPKSRHVVFLADRIVQHLMPFLRRNNFNPELAVDFVTSGQQLQKLRGLKIWVHLF